MNEDKWLFELPPQDLTAAEKKFKERNPIWTGSKAKLIERYLFYFVQITKTGNYIDAFAGPQEVDKHDMWSAKLVIESNPRWLRKFFLFELDCDKVQTIQAMWDAQPPRDKQKREPSRTFKLYSGDFNLNVNRMLAEHPIGPKEPTFCLLDQRTFECDWASVKAVASHKPSGHKIELFYFFPEGWYNRSEAALKHNKDERLQKWWGNSQWEDLLDVSGVLRAEKVREHFQTELGYKHVYPFPIYEKEGGNGRIMYYMIHATDHDEATKLMNRAYGKALDIKETGRQLDFLKEFGT